MPRSSLAFSSSTIWRIFLLPYIRRANARIVEVFPVPGGPYRRRWGRRYEHVSAVAVCVGSSIDIGIHEFVDGSEDILVARHIVKGLRSVFLHPFHLSVQSRRIEIDSTYHGRLSSASTGRFAALLLPLALVLSEENVMASSFLGPSRSMSSS